MKLNYETPAPRADRSRATRSRISASFRLAVSLALAPCAFAVMLWVRSESTLGFLLAAWCLYLSCKLAYHALRDLIDPP